MTALSLAFLLGALVMAVAVVRARPPLSGLLLVAVIMLSAPSDDEWPRIALAALVFIALMLLIAVRSTGAVMRAVALSVLATALALHSTDLAARLTLASGWQTATALGVTVAVVAFTSLCMAMADNDAPRLLPFACVGAVAVPAGAESGAVLWVSVAALLLLIRWRLRRLGAASA